MKSRNSLDDTIELYTDSEGQLIQLLVYIEKTLCKKQT